ncbi:MAG: type II toxin-antitoxin system RelE/ParE family toxin [Sulfolobales archaeon]|nr:type II toxin-antitoxin system RelE/ParE family toxin [Sulfolobales archaeon]
MMKKVREARDLARFVAREFSNLEYLRLIADVLELLEENPFKYSREKLGKDVYGNPMFSIEVTKDLRILYSVDPKNCIVFIWEIGSHKDVYGRD